MDSTNTPHVEISLCWQETLYQCECKFILVIRYCTERSANFLHFGQHVCFHVNFHPHKQLFFGPHSHMSTWVPKVLDLFAFPLIWLYICIQYIYILITSGIDIPPRTSTKKNRMITNAFISCWERWICRQVEKMKTCNVHIPGGISESHPSPQNSWLETPGHCFWGCCYPPKIEWDLTNGP